MEWQQRPHSRYNHPWQRSIYKYIYIFECRTDVHEFRVHFGSEWRQKCMRCLRCYVRMDLKSDWTEGMVRCRSSSSSVLEWFML